MCHGCWSHPARAASILLAKARCSRRYISQSSRLGGHSPISIPNHSHSSMASLTANEMLKSISTVSPFWTMWSERPRVNSIIPSYCSGIMVFIKSVRVILYLPCLWSPEGYVATPLRHSVAGLICTRPTALITASINSFNPPCFGADHCASCGSLLWQRVGQMYPQNAYSIVVIRPPMAADRPRPKIPPLKFSRR